MSIDGVFASFSAMLTDELTDVNPARGMRAGHPDYLIDRAGDRAIGEVKQFETTRVSDRLLAEPTVWWEHRVFIADEATARAAGYRPCGTCMRETYACWHSAEL